MPVRPEANRPHSHRRPAPARNYGRRAAALTATGTLAAGGIVLGAAPAVAADRDVANATGRFLSGTVGGTNLDDFVALAGAKAKNTGSPATVTEVNPLSLSLLNSISLPLGIGGLHLLEDNGILTLGAVQQYARANSDGSSRGASGAVSNSGAIDIGGSDGPPANATLNLDGLLADGPTGGVLSTLADVDVEIGALSALATQAEGEHGDQVGDYQIADLGIDLESPLLAGLLGTLTEEFALEQTDLLTTVTGLLGGLGLVEITGVPNLNTLVGGVEDEIGTPDLNVNLTTGAVHLDLGELLNLNNLPPNTNILTLLDGILTTQLLPLITAELDDLVDSVTTAFEGIGVTLLGVPVPVADVTPLLAPLLETVTGLVDTAISGQANLLGTSGAAGGLLGGALDGVLDLVANVQSNRNNEGTFTQRALRVGLLDLATVNLASATVGPNLGPVAEVLAPPHISEPDDGDETTDRTPPISGTGKVGYTVTVKEDGKTICKDEVNSEGKWSCTPSSKMSLGSHTISATQSNGDRTSGESNEVTFKIVTKTTTTNTSGGLPATGGGNTAPIAATGLGLLLGGAGLMAGNRRGSSGAHAKRGRHARV